MKMVSGIVLSIAIGSIFTFGCSRSNSSDAGSGVAAKSDNNSYQLPINGVSEAVDPNGAYAASFEDLSTGKEYVQTGSTVIEAIQRAQELCQIRAGGIQALCVLKTQFAVQLSPRLPNSGSIQSKSHACFAREFTNPAAFNNDRTWVGIGKTPSEARRAAEDKCQSKGGVDCRVTVCTNADYDKEVL